MTNFINDETIENVRGKIDIVDLISEYVQLKKAGNNYVGLCPFHQEKTPSFTVTQNKELFHCFGCGVGGDAVTFIMKKENLDFPDAISFLADKYGIEIEKTANTNSQVTDIKSKTYEINKEAAIYYRSNLFSNKKALEYLINRKISEKAIKQFGLGYSLDSWDDLFKYLTKKGYKSDEIEKTGLIGSKSGSNNYYDKLRDRIIFPIMDNKSRVIGFGGRVLNSDKHPKYLNSPETVVFNKGNHLYGLNLLNKYSNRKKILLVEGYMDVISLFSRGINYSVASLGTALTEKQSKLIKRYGEEIYICYDSDSAGINATLRAINILTKDDINPKILLLPKDMDPDDYIKEYGIKKFETLILNSINSIEFKIYNVKENMNLQNSEDKIRFTREVSKIIKELKSPIEQDVYIEKIAQETGISKAAIEREIRGNKNFKINPNKQIYENRIRTIKPVENVLSSGRLKAEAELIQIMIKDRDYFEYIRSKVSIEDFENEGIRRIYDYINNYFCEEELTNENVLIMKILEIPNIGEEVNDILNNLKLNYKPSNINKIIDDLINRIKNNNMLNKSKCLLIKIEELEKKERTIEEEDLFKKLCLELFDLNRQISSNN